MANNIRISLIGEVLVDVSLSADDEHKLRFGGIFHAARTLWALDIDYDLLYIAPDYLAGQINDYAIQHGSKSSIQIGSISGCPNVILINDATEVKNQGYELLLRDLYSSELNFEKIQGYISENSATDYLIFPGGYNLGTIIHEFNNCNGNFHIDIANGLNDIQLLGKLSRKFETIILSTSSNFFLETYDQDLELLKNILLKDYCNNFLFKENRGGTRFFSNNGDQPTKINSQTRPIVHSVGVGDCFDIVYIVLKNQHSKKTALNYASWIAAEYASTTYPDDFKKNCQRVLSIPQKKIESFKGISIPWEDRTNVNIYIAAPDFDFIDTTAVRTLVECLKYHNFSPRLPIQENGQIEKNASNGRKKKLFLADMKLIDECQLIVAVLLNYDPGTMIEIGLAAGTGKPVIVYDPYNIAENLMLTELPRIVSNNLDEIISEVFISTERFVNNE